MTEVLDYKTLVVLSGGMDSATLAYQIKRENKQGMAVSFDYGQRHKLELDCARDIANELGWTHSVVRLEGLTELLPGCSLTDNDVDTPHGHYAEENMKTTVVPSRNAMMLSIAHGIAVANGCDEIATAVHAGDHHIYPDCRPEFTLPFIAALNKGGYSDVLLYTPYIKRSKTDIAAIGAVLGVPFHKTWTCYDPQRVEDAYEHCGLCGSCQERKEAFTDSSVEDPTRYAA